MVVEVQVQAHQPQHVVAVIHQLILIIIVQSFLLELMLHVNNITMVITEMVQPTAILKILNVWQK